MREQFGLLDGLEWKNLQHEKVSSRRGNRFSYTICLNSRSYATWRGKSRSGCLFSREIRVESFTIRVKTYRSSKRSSENLPDEWKLTFRVKPYRSSESLLFKGKLTGRVKVWHPSELIIIWVKILPSELKLADRVRDCLSEWKYSHPSGNMVIRVKLSSR